jgi:hypothetical protein
MKIQLNLCASTHIMSYNSPLSLQRSSSGDSFSFLVPPHFHNPTDISRIAALPTDLLSNVPLDVQDSLWLLQESTSVLYASHLRLQDLVSEKFDRLHTTKDPNTCRPYHSNSERLD